MIQDFPRESHAADQDTNARRIDRAHETVRHLTIRGAGPGSVEHFFHFLLGFHVPLVYHLTNVWDRGDFDRLLVRSCGPLDPLVREIGDDRIEIVDKSEHSRMAEQPAGFDAIEIKGNDYPRTYDARRFSAAREHLAGSDAVQAEIRALSDTWPRDDGRILLIQRGAGPAFYDSERSEAKGSGMQRRSIANHDALFQAIRNRHRGCINIKLENTTLARQFALFHLADVMIAQHGAALANIIWARNDATVIEIVPRTLRPDQKENDFFRNLAWCTGLRYRRILQSADHGDVDIGAIMRQIDRAVATRHHPIGRHARCGSFRMAQPLMPITQRVRSLAGRIVRRLRIASSVRS